MKQYIFITIIFICTIDPIFAKERDLDIYDFSNRAEEMCKEPQLYGYVQTTKGDANIDIALLIKRSFGANVDVGGEISKQDWLNVPQNDLLEAIKSRRDCVISALKLLFTIHQNLKSTDSSSSDNSCKGSTSDNCINQTLLLGKWKSSHTYNQETGPLKIKGITEYFKTGGYNFQGILSAEYNDTNTVLEFDLRATGKWVLNGSDLFIETVDMMSTITSINFDGELH